MTDRQTLHRPPCLAPSVFANPRVAVLRTFAPPNRDHSSRDQSSQDRSGQDRSGQDRSGRAGQTGPHRRSDHADARVVAIATARPGVASRFDESFRRRLRWGLIAAVVFVVWLGVCISFASAESSDASWSPAGPQTISDDFSKALSDAGFDDGVIDEARVGFQRRLDDSVADPLDAFVASAAEHFAPVDALYRNGLSDPAAAAGELDPSKRQYAEMQDLPVAVRTGFQTWLGRELVRRNLFDEALPVFAEVDVETCVDPASLLFHRGTCYHAMLMKKEALRDLRQLLEVTQGYPRRYERTAKLLVADLKPLKEDSLDEISRLMTDVTRRLDLGRAGEKVDRREEEVIEKLSKLIEDLEKQQQQQQQQMASGGGGGGGGGNPMQDSMPGGGSGNGDVDKKSLENKNAWGNLPPAERKEALQDMFQDLPTHHRDAIEAYFRKMAKQ